MSSTKCRKCGLINFSTQNYCKRCGTPFVADGGRKPTGQSSSGRPRFSIVALAAFAVVGAIGYYSFKGLSQSMKDVDSSEANRSATQQKPNQRGLSRTEYDRQRAGQYGNSLKKNPSFDASNKHNDDVQKAMQESTGSKPSH